MRYPDASTGNPSSTDKESYAYNQLGQVLTKTDRNSSVHSYAYDVLGRMISDIVSTLASGVDGAVRRMETAYDSQGNGYLITTFDAVTSGSVVNQVQREFNGLAQLTREWQAVSGTVNTGTTPSVQYAFSFVPSGSTNHSRLTSITYPNGRVLTYNYASGLDADISRLSSISDGGTTLENYEYLGYGTVVKRGHPESGVDLTYIKLTGESDGPAGDKYIGLDTFARIVDQRWTTSGGTARDRFGYGYDRNSNRLYKKNVVEATMSELYAYDDLNQITNFDRGTLNGTNTGIVGTPSRTQEWDFDAVGNFDSVTTDGVTQTRTHNRLNEITGISSATTPTYDANGNLTKDETGRTFKYDPWNRLVEIKNSGGTTLATYKWDGTGRRVSEIRSGTNTDLYYSDQWQVLEERISGTTRISYAWSAVYVDAMIARDRDSDNNGSLEERFYVAQDANFNVAALIDTSDNVVERYVYDAFGAFTVLTGAWGLRVSSNYAWKYLHQGGRWDVEGGLYSFRNREFSPTFSRWFQLDPIGFISEEINLYESYRNDPLNKVDPFGLEVQTKRFENNLAPIVSDVKKLPDPLDIPRQDLLGQPYTSHLYNIRNKWRGCKIELSSDYTECKGDTVEYFVYEKTNIIGRSDPTVEHLTRSSYGGFINTEYTRVSITISEIYKMYQVRFRKYICRRNLLQSYTFYVSESIDYVGNIRSPIKMVYEDYLGHLSVDIKKIGEKLLDKYKGG